MMDKREVALDLAFRLYGKPYRWGGDDTLAGFDCSGFICELLKSVGILNRVADLTAQGLREFFSTKATTIPSRGCLVFWGDKSRGATHVEIMLDEELAIGSSGGGSATTTLDEAIKTNAFIKVRPYASRPGVLGFVDPFRS